MEVVSIIDLKSHYSLWKQHVDANITIEEFSELSEERKNSWLKIMGRI